jgi:type VII secretion-associated serine protease mycosin
VLRALLAAAVLGTVVLTGAPATAAGCPGPSGPPYPGVPWAQQRLGASQVWPLTRGRGSTVAVVDSGVSATHPQLHDAVRGGDNVLDSSSPTRDCVGHGTVVAGIIAGRGAPGTGFTGVAPDAQIVSVKTLENVQRAQGAEDQIARGIEAAISSGADVINVSAAGYADSPRLAAAVRHASARDIVVVAAAGNDEQHTGAPMYPAAYEGVLTVAAITRDGALADFSAVHSYIEVAAPGEDIVGPAPTGGGYLTGASGTSFAAPYVAGVAALVRAYYPHMHAAEVVRRITVTADAPATGSGYGVVDPYRAVTAVVAAPARRQVAEVVPPRAGDTADPLRDTRIAALTVSAAAVLLLLGAVLAAAVLPRGHRRAWRPGRITR